MPVIASPAILNPLPPDPQVLARLAASASPNLIAAPGPAPRAYNIPGIQPPAGASPATPLRSPGIASPAMPPASLMPAGAPWGPAPKIASPATPPLPTSLALQKAKDTENAINPPNYTGKLGVLEKIGDVAGRLLAPGIEQRLGVGTLGYQDRLAQAEGQTDRLEKQAGTEAGTAKAGADAQLETADANKAAQPPPPPAPRWVYNEKLGEYYNENGADQPVPGSAAAPLENPKLFMVPGQAAPVVGYETPQGIVGGDRKPIAGAVPYAPPQRTPATDLDNFTKQYLADHKLADTSANRLAAKNAWGHAGAVDTGEGWTAIPGAAGAGAANSAPLAPDPFGGVPLDRDDAALAGLTPAQISIVRGIDDGRISGEYLLRYGKQNMEDLLGRVAQYDPSFDAVNYNARAKTRQAFTSGVPAQQVNALNTAIGHLAQLSTAADALDNGSWQSMNAVKNWFQKETGNPNITNFQAVVKPVADELTRVWRGTGGSEADIKNRLDALSSSNSPEQLHGAIQQLADLMESKIGALQNQYEQGMGVKNVNMVTPSAQRVLDAISGNGGGNAGALPAGVAPGSIKMSLGGVAHWVAPGDVAAAKAHGATEVK